VTAPLRAPPAAPATQLLLRVEDLRIHFGPADAPRRAVDGAAFEVADGECVALVGESGCGKSLTGLALARLVPEPAGRVAGGRVLWRGRDVLRMGARELAALRGGGIAYVFQEPGAAWNPVLRIGAQIAENLRLHVPGADAVAEVAAGLARVGLPDPAACARAYPHQLSGGQQQRAMLAMALAARPRLLVADEPTTALDVTVQAQILDRLAGLRRDLGMAVLFITHNLAIVPEIADRALVMYAGQIVESAPAGELIAAPRHPYTRALLDAIPRFEGPRSRPSGIPGAVPDPSAFPPGCRFHPRCPFARDRCRRDMPADAPAGEGRRVRCHFPREVEGGRGVLG